MNKISLDSIVREVYQNTSILFSSKTENYRKTLAYKLLNVAKSGDVFEFLNIATRAILSVEEGSSKNLAEYLRRLLMSNINHKKIMYAFILGLLRGEINE
jgi:hypothetical protein